METFNSDPKPGRLILPLVLIGMIATTYTFINRVATNNSLDIVEDTTTTTISTEASIDTTTTSTTTTLPEGVVNYLEEITGEKIQVIELGKKVLEANQRWDDKITTYQEAQQEFQDFIDDNIFESMYSDDQFILTISENGYGKRSSAYEYRITNRGGQGIINIETSERNGNVIASFPVLDTDDVMMVTNKGRIIRSPVNDIRIASRNTQGVTLFSIDDGEKVVSVTTISLDENEDNDEVIIGDDNIENVNNVNEDENKND